MTNDEAIPQFAAAMQSRQLALADGKQLIADGRWHRCAAKIKFWTSPPLNAELSAPAALNLVCDMIIEVGAYGVTFFEAVFELYPDLDVDEADRLADILEAAFDGST